MSKSDGINNRTGQPYWKRDPEKMWEVKRRHLLKKNYSLTLEDYNNLVDEQSFCCAICGLCLAYCKNVCVDHNHKTGKVRGILCGKCNKALGLVDERLETLREMIKYLEEHI